MDEFSKRHGFRTSNPPITVREDAPEFLRSILPSLAYREGVGSSALRHLICGILRVAPDRNNWSEPNVDAENEGNLRTCEWYRVYDIAEAIYARIAETSGDPFLSGLKGSAKRFESKLNEEFMEGGIGWRMVAGKIQTRGEEGFESTVRNAAASLELKGWAVAANEIREALTDLSRRPKADKTGAIHHGMNALECAAREVSRDPKPTLGELMKRYKEKLGIPPPLDGAVEKLWGYASQFGRHVREGAEPSRDDTELMVSICAALCTYLARRPEASGFVSAP